MRSCTNQGFFFHIHRHSTHLIICLANSGRNCSNSTGVCRGICPGVGNLPQKVYLAYSNIICHWYEREKVIGESVLCNTGNTMHCHMMFQGVLILVPMAFPPLCAGTELEQRVNYRGNAHYHYMFVLKLVSSYLGCQLITVCSYCAQ